MKCSKCSNEMRKGYLFSTKDGAFSFANDVPSALKNARNSEGFVKITNLKSGGRTAIEAHICENCRQVILEY